MKKKVDLFCVECGKFLGEYYGFINDKSLIDGKKQILCPSKGIMNACFTNDVNAIIDHPDCEFNFVITGKTH